MLNQKKKAEKVQKKIRTCIHQPFEFNMRSLDQQRSQELATLIGQFTGSVKFGIRSCIRVLKKKQPLVFVILILDQSILEIITQTATILAKCGITPILAREEFRAPVKKWAGIEKITCIYMVESNEQGIEIEDLKQKLQSFREDSICEIPIIIQEELTLKPVKLLHHIQTQG